MGIWNKAWKKGLTIVAPKPSVNKSKLYKDMAESKIKMMKDMGKFQKKVSIDKYKEKKRVKYKMYVRDLSLNVITGIDNKLDKILYNNK